jgi:hypothetical protein
MIIRLPVKPFIKKYLNRQFGKELKLSDPNFFSGLIKGNLKKFEKGNPIVQRNNNKLIDGINFLGYDIFIGEGIYRERGAFIATKDILFINEAIDNLICRSMYDWIYSPASPHKEVDYNIIAFRDMYDISEDELPFDNLKRWFYRERIRMQQRADYLIPDRENQLIIDFKYDPEKPIIPDMQLNLQLVV